MESSGGLLWTGEIYNIIKTTKKKFAQVAVIKMYFKHYWR